MSLNTNGWDYIYNLRFSKVKSLFESLKTPQDAITALKNTLAIALGKKLTSEIVVKSNTYGVGVYSPPPTVAILSNNSGTAPIFTLKNDFVGEIKVDNSKITADYTIAPTIAVSGGELTTNVIMNVLRIRVTNPGSNYSAAPTVTIVDASGKGTGAKATAQISNGKVTFIEVTNLGSGYVTANIPTVSISGTATAVASFTGIKININNPGTGYTSAPTITISGGDGVGATATALIGLRVESSSGGSGYTVPPIVEIPPQNTTNIGATAFASMKFENSSLIVGDKGSATPVVYAKESIKACLKEGLKSIVGYTDCTILDTTVQETDSNVLEYCLGIIASLVGQRHVSKKAENLELQFLFDYETLEEAKKLAESIITNYYSTETEKTPTKAIEKLKSEEIEKIKNRVTAGLQFVDNQIIYNINEIPNSSSPKKTLGQLGAELEKNKEGFLESMIELLLALYPQQRIYNICGILRDNHADSKQYPLKKIKLNTGTFVLEEGGTDSLLKINIPIKSGLFYFGQGSKTFIDNDNNKNFNIPLLLNLNWMRGAFKTTLPTSPQTNYVDLAVDSLQLENNINTALPGISNRNKQIVRIFIEHYIQNFVKNQDSNIQFFDLVKQHYSYHDVFSHLNIATYEALGIGKQVFDKTKNSQKWIFPTRIAYAAKDEVTLPTDVKNSIFSICCMINGKSNNDAGYTDINAIPDVATSALVIDRSVFAEHMVKPAFAKDNKLFTLTNDQKKTVDEEVAKKISEDNKALEDKKKEKLTDADKKTITQNAIRAKLADVTDKAMTKGSAYSFSNSIEVGLKSKDYLDKYNAAVAGTVPAEKLNISVEESSINVAMSDVEYWYNKKNSPTINQEYIFNLKPGIVPNFEAKEKLFIISNDFKPNQLWEYLLNFGGPIIRYGLLEPIATAIQLKRNGFNSGHFVKISKKKKKLIKPTQVAQSPQRQQNPIIDGNDSVQVQLNQRSGNASFSDNENQETKRLTDSNRKSARDSVISIGGETELMEMSLDINSKRNSEEYTPETSDKSAVSYLSLFFEKINFLKDQCVFLKDQINKVNTLCGQKNKVHLFDDLRTEQMDNFIRYFARVEMAETNCKLDYNFKRKYEEKIRANPEKWDKKTIGTSDIGTDFYLFKSDNKFLPSIRDEVDSEYKVKIDALITFVEETQNNFLLNGKYRRADHPLGEYKVFSISSIIKICNEIINLLKSNLGYIPRQKALSELSESWAQKYK